jgi:hypothetical protein
VYITGFKKVLVQKKDERVAVITSLNLSKKSGVMEALVMYNGNMDAT